MRTIIVMRHPEKDGDKITAVGAMQTFAAAQTLAELGYKPSKFFWSGACRTYQAMLVARAAFATVIGDGQGIPQIMKCDRLHFQPILEKMDKADADAVIPDIKRIKTAGGTLRIALEMSRYAGFAREKMNEALIEIAVMMDDGETAIAFSHSPLTEMAAMDLETPYGLGEADAIVYEMGYIDGVKLVNSTLIKAPIAGKTN